MKLMITNNSNLFANLSSIALLGSSLFIATPGLAYNYSDNQPYSQSPPQDLSPNQVPMFVSIGFDDNGISGVSGSGGTGGLTWFLNFIRTKHNPNGAGNAATYDGSPVRVTFFNTAEYSTDWHNDDPVYIKQAWHTAFVDGHEIGNHTVSHSPGGSNFTLAKWNTEIANTQTHLSKPFDPNEPLGNANPATGMGADITKLTGFRSPFLEYNNNTFIALKQNGLTYDTSIEEGWHYLMDGTNYPWPYTLNSGSPGHQVMVDYAFPNKTPISSHSGLWELGVTPLIIPPDNKTATYGINYSIRNKVKNNIPWFEVASGKITAFDWNLWTDAKLNKAETLATLKYTLDLRRENGNRAPFMLGAHTDYFNSKKASLASQITVKERQEVIEEFITYALSKPEVRIVPFKSIINWMRSPSPLNESLPPPNITNPGNKTNVVNDVINFTIQATDSTGFPLTFSSNNLPSGLSINANTGVISGTLTTARNQTVTITVSNTKKSSTINFSWLVTELIDPWEAIVALGLAINDLQEYNDSLNLTLFTGSTWQEQLASLDKISADLFGAAMDCWNGKPDLAITKLNRVLGYINQEMLPSADRSSLIKEVKNYIPRLKALVGANF
ncbi:MAG: putative Ig domain-containing protein [Methylococcales bacterium]|nr:putative Ig domain-containing protein [Methylococcales bacterium]